MKENWGCLENGWGAGGGVFCFGARWSCRCMRIKMVSTMRGVRGAKAIAVSTSITIVMTTLRYTGYDLPVLRLAQSEHLINALGPGGKLARVYRLPDAEEPLAEPFIVAGIQIPRVLPQAEPVGMGWSAHGANTLHQHAPGDGLQWSESDTTFGGVFPCQHRTDCPS